MAIFKLPRDIDISIDSLESLRKLLSLSTAVFLLGLGGCSFNQASPLSNLDVPNPLGIDGPITPVADIYQQPEGVVSEPTEPATAEEPVYLRGRVAQRLPLLEGWLYQVEDETGLIWVITSGVAPEVGDRVTVKGTVAFESVPIADEELGDYYIQELEHEVRANVK
ncbi:MAG: hypothetical protein AAF215_18120 [Cyanobacteria bacterium P01_A01_bin.123]